MKSYVITIMDNVKSVQAAERCIKSGKRYDIDIEMWAATTPQNSNVFELAKTLGISTDGFKEVYSRYENCTAAFLSHFSLWGQSLVSNQDVQIFEHDAFITGPIATDLSFRGCINLGQPSYGKYNTPPLLGVNTLTSKKYFPGAHAYRINPYGAEQLLKQARVAAKPTDVFLHIDTFPWLEEYYPWPVEARDHFTTIQKTEGCLAKHNYWDGYEIV